jgi:cytochrome c biogenesis protein CcmG, thiol:disulfide interchange protein DsbE
VTDRPGFTHRRERRGLIGPFGGRQLLLGGVVIAVSAVVLVVVTTPLGSVNSVGPGDPRATQFVLDPNAQIGVRPGQIPPELQFTRADGSVVQLQDLTGRPVRLADLRGTPVWINFWASWCPPCQSETPIIRDIAARYRDQGLVVIGVDVQETTDIASSYAARYQLGYVIAPDVTGDIFRTYGPRGLPTSIFVGPEGAVRSFVLAPLSTAAATAQIEAILGGGASPGASPAASPSPG